MGAFMIRASVKCCHRFVCASYLDLTVKSFFVTTFFAHRCIGVVGLLKQYLTSKICTTSMPTHKLSPTTDT